MSRPADGFQKTIPGPDLIIPDTARGCQALFGDFLSTAEKGFSSAGGRLRSGVPFMNVQRTGEESGLLFYNLYSIWTSKGSSAASFSLISSAKLHPSARYAAWDSFEE